VSTNECDLHLTGLIGSLESPNEALYVKSFGSHTELDRELFETLLLQLIVGTHSMATQAMLARCGTTTGAIGALSIEASVTTGRSACGVVCVDCDSDHVEGRSTVGGRGAALSVTVDACDDDDGLASDEDDERWTEEVNR
jgi:hypothetical protein